MRKMRKVFLAPLPLKQVILKLSFCLCSVLFKFPLSVQTHETPFRDQTLCLHGEIVCF